MDAAKRLEYAAVRALGYCVGWSRCLLWGWVPWGRWNWGWNDVRNSDGWSCAAASPPRMVGQGCAAVRRVGLRLRRGRLDQRTLLVPRRCSRRPAASLLRRALRPGSGAAILAPQYLPVAGPPGLARARSQGSGRKGAPCSEVADG